MKRTIFITIASILVMAVGCTEKPEETPGDTLLRSMTFRIGGVESEQFHLYDGVQWQAFTKEESIAEDAYCGTAYEAERFYCIHPFSESFSFVDGKVKVTIPQNQSCAVDGVDTRASFYGGVSRQNEIEMHSLCSVVQFTLADEGITKVRISGKGSERIAGRHNVVFNDDHTVGLNPALGVDDWTTAILTPSDSTAFKAGKWGFVIYPRNFTKGMTLEFASADGKLAQKDFPALEVLAGRGYDLGEITLGWNQTPDEPENPDDPENPEEPEEPENPDEPEEPDTTDKAGASTESYTDGNSYEW